MAGAGVALVTEADGTISGEEATGLYHRDRRIVSGMRLLVDGQPPVYLNGAATGAATHRLTYGHWGDSPDPLAVIVRERSLNNGYQEHLSIHCFRDPISLQVEVHLLAGGGTVYHLDQETHSPEDARLLAEALWADGAAKSGLTLKTNLSVNPGTPSSFSWGIKIDVEMPTVRPSTLVTTGDSRLQRALESSAWTFEALTVQEPRTGISFLAAGAPHFLALFGRDALFASILSMVADPRRTLETIEILASYQGKDRHPLTLEDHGRILHELRIGDMGVFDLDPGTAYYGSIDATPLFVVAMSEALCWGISPSQLEPLLPMARSAIAWCRAHTDKFGFIQSVPHDGGIANQNWKDSGDSIVRPDGSVVQGATSPVEVQGYFHQALYGLAELESAFGNRSEAAALFNEAETFAERFHQHFLVDEPCLVALALDASGEPIPVRASNVGHLLGTDLITDELAGRLVDRLFSEEEFSGWGVRTLAASEAAYNPLGYHVGSVWPHDNAVLLRGLAHRRFDSQTRRLAAALVELAVAERHQLPELLGGFPRTQIPEPVPYPASARPQAWAAAVPYQIVTALLGLQPEIHHNRVRIHSVLKDDQRIKISRLRLGERMIDIDARGSDATVSGDIDGLTISVET